MESKRWGPNAQVLVALVSGVLIGLGLSLTHNSTWIAAGASVETIGNLWINAIRMTVIPLVISLLFVSMTAFPDVRSAGRTGAHAMMIFVALLGVSTAFAALTVPSLFAVTSTGPVATDLASSAGVSSVVQQAQQLPTFAQWLADVVPANPIRAAAEGTMLPLVIFSIAFGLAATHISAELRAPLVMFFQGVSESMQTLVRWLVKLAPVGVFCLIVPLAAHIGPSAVGEFGYYVIVLSALLCILSLVLWIIAAVFGRVSLRRFAVAVFPALSIAFSSRSSLASLPAMIEGAERTLPCPPVIAGFALPLAVSVFKVTAPVVWLSCACFVARLYGIHLSAADMGQILALSFLLSFCTPGIPMGSLLMLAPLFLSVGLPAAGIGILIAIDLIPDIFKTIANVMGDMTATALLSRGVRGGGPD